MSGAVVDGQVRMQLLLDKLSVASDLREKYFAGATIQKLQVMKKEKRWVFHFLFPHPLPSTIYETFRQQIIQSFSHLATIDTRFQFSNVEVPKLVDEYWFVFLEQYKTLFNGLYRRLKENPPQWSSHETLRFTVHNEVEQSICQKKIEPALLAFFGQFTDWHIAIEYTLEESDLAYQHLLESIEQEEKEKVQQSLEGKRRRVEEQASNDAAESTIVLGYAFQDEAVPLAHIVEEERRISLQGQLFGIDQRELKSGRTLFTFHITDYTDSIAVKVFSNQKEDIERLSSLRENEWLHVRGNVQMDTFQHELVLMANDIQRISVAKREDTAEQKRVELHVHTNMSTMDAVPSISDYVEQAAKWGHPAIAVTDHAVVQAFPEAAAAAAKHDMKMIYGVEINLVHDGVPICYRPEERLLKDETYIVFDVETTGLSAVYNKIIELAAVKMRDGEVIDRFESFVNPHEPISRQITNLTGIRDDMVKDAPDIEPVLHDFLTFIGSHTLVAHNASFDMGFLDVGYKALGEKLTNPVLDTLELARMLYPDMRNHRLNTLAKKLKVKLENHHRAVYDAEATGHILTNMIKDCLKQDITRLDQLNEQKGDHHYRSRPTHCTLLAVNDIGLKNIYKLVSAAHVHYFYRTPRVPRSLLAQYREGILVGSACDKGEIFEGVMQKTPEEVEKLVDFYDFLEVQPVSNYAHLIEKELVKNEQHIQQLIQQIIDLGKRFDKVVVATGNVHYMDPKDAIYRKIIISTLGKATPLNADNLPPVHFRTTDEMLAEFSFLGEDVAHDIVVQQPNDLANKIDSIQPIPDKLYTPNIEGADEEIRKMSYDKAKSIYGDPLPELVEKRLEKELTSIIGHGFAVIYLISQKLVLRSLQDGYLVGSRGSVGSSFVATMTGITEVNPLPPHYVCLSCHYSEFFEDGSVGSGFDLADANCPECGTPMHKDGQYIPFETFLGFKGDKVPDIDLNFSGDYQPVAHKYTQDLFGKDNVYRAGTIGTVADKTAYGFVKKYEEEYDVHLRQAEISRLAKGCTGVKRTTGQHPGGIIVVPDDMEIYDFTPIQYPADDQSSEWRTTHFDFHSIHDNLLKLDILGHDDPTVIRMLQDLTGIDPQNIDIDDPEVMKIFSGTEALGVTEEQIMSKMGTLGIPEFGTRFVRQMLEDTKPTTFAELVRISGLSHGTDVWLNNAQEVIRQGHAVLSEVISTRDDIMVYLIQKGLEESRAFKLMEQVRKGKGLSDDDIAYMREHDVPEWYIESCLKIKYMFPKAHAAAYVLMAVRIAYFKVHYPIYFYASYFTVRADDFDIDLALQGSGAVREEIKNILEKGTSASPKEKSMLTVLELVLEMLERGFTFRGIDLYASDSETFLVDDNDALLCPFNAVPGIGTNAAKQIVNARKAGEFLSIEDLQSRTKISKTVVEHLQAQGCLDGLPETNQLSLF